MSFFKLGSWLGIFSCCVFSIALASTTLAQDEDFASLKAAWTELEKQLAEQQSAIDSGDMAAEADFRDLVDQANTMIGQLKAAGIKSIESDPNNKDVIRTLMGIMVNDAHFKRDKEVIRLGDELIEAGLNPRYFEVAAETDRLNIKAREIFEELSLRRREAEEGDLPRVKFVTTKGEIVFELFENEAPNTVANFVTLIEKKYYDGIVFHRVLEGFMAQTGCPNGNGMGGPGYTVPCECYTPAARRHFSGSLSMANTGARDSGGSQIFLTFSRTQNLDGLHTVFGRVITGWDILDRLSRTHQGSDEVDIPGVEKDKILSAEVIRKRDHKYKVRKTGEPDEPEEEEEQPPIEPATDEPEMKNEESNDDASDEDDDTSDDDASEESLGEDVEDGSTSDDTDSSDGDASKAEMSEETEESPTTDESETETEEEPESTEEGGGESEGDETESDDG